ncbi:LysR family transcriptional regulator ArgP [Albidovulum sp.]
MFDYPALEALAAVLRTGSFDRAAAELHVTPSAVSQRIRALEERVGSALVIRSHPCRATETGARLARHVEDVRLLEHGLEAEIGGAAGAAAGEGETRSTVRIAVNADSLATWFLPAAAAQPALLFDFVIDDQDHSTDWLRRGEVHAAVTASERPAAGCESHPLGAMIYAATCTPDFRRRWFADAVDAGSLARAPALCFNRKDRLQDRWAAARAGAPVALPVHYLASSRDFVTAARLGLGWGMNPLPLVSRDLEAGRLVELVPGARLETPLYWQVRRLAAPALRALTRSVREAARAVLRQGPPA